MTIEPIDAIPETFAWVGSNGGYTVWESEDGVQHIVQPDGGECYLVTWGGRTLGGSRRPLGVL